MASASRMALRNRTELNTGRLESLILRYDRTWACGRLAVSVRYSRGADFSGTCIYAKRRIHVNIGRHVAFPYRMSTCVARARSDGTFWWKDEYFMELADAYQLVLFVFLHELYHWLVKKAGHNPRQKESMCDRFAARVLADECGCVVRDSRGRRVRRESWDFQDLEGFVAAARRTRGTRRSPAPAARAARQADWKPDLPLLPPGVCLA